MGPEIEKISLLRISLVHFAGEFYAVKVFRRAPDIFHAKLRSQHAVRMHSAEVDALFRIKRMKPACCRE